MTHPIFAAHIKLQAATARHEELTENAKRAPKGYRDRTLNLTRLALNARMAEENRLHRLAVRND